MSKKQFLVKGIPASPGIVFGYAVVLQNNENFIEEKNIPDSEIDDEVNRFIEAVNKAKKELEILHQRLKLSGNESEAGIFQAQKLLIDDIIQSNAIIKKIKETKKNAEFIFYETLKTIIEQFNNSDSPLLKERTYDLNDIKNRILRNLIGIDYLSKIEHNKKTVIVARELAPSDITLFLEKNVLGFVTDIGGKSSHVAILARSLEIPAVVGTKSSSRLIVDGDFLIVDGTEGVIFVNPDTKTLKEYKGKYRAFHIYEKQLIELKHLPAQTIDGYKFELSANVELPVEVNSVLKYGADGIGLFRTEYLFLTRSELPSEEEQFNDYFYMAEKLYPKSVIIRTFDLGGDKYTPNIDFPKEANPFLGWRAIRVSLDRPDLFVTQLRAILRASKLGNVKIMFPLISGYSELKQAIEILETTKDDLRKEGVEFDENLEIGIMIEIPSAVLIADKLGELVDFFSIGTNDLTQYTLAVDRGNEKIAYLYDGLHPAVIKLIHRTIVDGHKKGLWVGICGDLASNPLAVILLIAMGIDELSVSPIYIPEIKNIIRFINYKEILNITRDVMDLNNAFEIKQYLLNYLEANSFPINYRFWGDFYSQKFNNGGKN